MKANQICEVIVALTMAVVSARADSLELKNGSLIKGKFMGGNPTSISFQVCELSSPLGRSCHTTLEMSPSYPQ